MIGSVGCGRDQAPILLCKDARTISDRLSVGFDGNERLEVAIESVKLAVWRVCRSRWIRCAGLVAGWDGASTGLDYGDGGGDADRARRGRTEQDIAGYHWSWSMLGASSFACYAAMSG